MASLKKRGNCYWIQYYVGTKQVRKSLNTASRQIAKDKKAKIEVELARGATDPFPTKTPIADVLDVYIEHIRSFKTTASFRTDLWYLREMFGPICPALEIAQKKPAAKSGRTPYVTGACFEALTSAQLSDFVTSQVLRKNLAPKTANRYREILCAMFNWAVKERGVRLPNSTNPASAIKRRRVPAPTIEFLSIKQIEEQLNALEKQPVIQTLVAVYIYAGLRRAEALWLTRKDVDLKAGANGVIHVRQKTIQGDSWEPKTKSNRVIPISATLRHYLDRYQLRIVPGHWYFPSPQGCRWDPDNFSAALRDANSKARLTWSCLEYRHTFGSQLAMKGVSLYKIATLMGNSPEICQRHYATIIPESLETEVEFPQMGQGFSTR